KNHMSVLSPDDVVRVKRAFDKDRQASLVEERVGDGTVIRRRSRVPATAPRGQSPVAHIETIPPASEAASRMRDEVAAPPSAEEEPYAEVIARAAAAEPAMHESQARRQQRER